ncbi:hypothetical protein [Candidatus Burkholderia verschuerenii]|uniref:hypothetical protein n=1 Tax=Candidatus Burkholderia verschuerenii TaxID=242163 RepID=UPI00067AAAFF|nr:hypothetical protein [Candidatus Burkholderia verschuerenii]
MGSLLYRVTTKSGDTDIRSTPNATPIPSGETVEIFIEIDETVRSLDFIGYSMDARDAIPVRAHIEAGFLRWKLLGPREDA